MLWSNSGREFLSLFFLAGFCFLGCQGSKSDPPAARPVATLENLVGAWEVDSMTVNGFRGVLEANSTGAAAGYPTPAGYPGWPGKIQYDISETEIYTIVSDDVSVTSKLGESFSLDGNRLIKSPLKNGVSTGFEVLAFTETTLVLRSDDSREGLDIQFNLIRIQESELATNKLKPIEQRLTYLLKTSDSYLEGTQTSMFPEDLTPGTKASNMICKYKKGQSSNFEINIYGYEVLSSEKTSMDVGDLPRINIDSDVQFDFAKHSEEVKLNLPPAQGFSPLYGVLTQEAETTVFSLGDLGKCDLRVNRDGRDLSVSGTCDAIQVTRWVGSKGSTNTGSLSLKGRCVLQF